MTGPNDPRLSQKAADLIAQMRSGSTPPDPRPRSTSGNPPSRGRVRLLGWLLALAVVGVVAFGVAKSRWWGRDTTVPSELLGRWATTAPSHAHTPFIITPTTLVFHREGADSTEHRITNIRAVEQGEGTLYTITYLSENQLFDFSFHYTSAPEPAIRFRNQRQMTWQKLGP